jgi:hypothetical protein
LDCEDPRAIAQIPRPDRPITTDDRDRVSIGGERDGSDARADDRGCVDRDGRRGTAQDVLHLWVDARVDAPGGPERF